MKTKILAAILAVTLTTVPITETVSWHKGRYYAQCCVASNDVVTVENCNGFRYTFRSCEEDWYVGDAASVIMDTNGTELVTDDKVVAAKYDRPDLL